jgi:UDP-GlcNAc:undecaprenyl-phosphate/decaprenyl-phosphate GlcNAc-1-phosphate transferase
MITQWFYFVGVLALSFGLAFYITPVVRKGALRFGVLDHPDGKLKQHQAPVAYLGGIAVYVAFVVSLSLIFQFSGELLGLLLGGTMIAMLGLFDDLKVLTPGIKLVGQCLAIWVLLRSNIAIHLTLLPFWLSLPLTVFWLLAITNAINLVDVSDGLAVGCSAIAALTLFVLAVLQQEIAQATVALALCGTLLGFLSYNKPPATIYLGDSGSLFLGFMLATMTLLGRYTSHSVVGAFAPLFVLSVPLLELWLLVLARLAKRQSPLHGSPDHFAIRLKKRGASANQILYFSYGLALFGAVLAVAISWLPKSFALGTAAFGFAGFISVGVWLWQQKPGL